jgi:hypothetical protein
MLADLLSRESRADLRSRLNIETNDFVYWLYHYGRRFKDGWHEVGPTGENLWQHAEEFLDKLDAAVEPVAESDDDEPSGDAEPLNLLAERLESILDQAPGALPREAGRLRKIRGLARRYVAAECGEFLRRALPSSEQWEPHTSWFQRLETSDVVISFNYDRVIEVLAERAEREKLGNCNVIRNPRDWKVQTFPRILKLHGSVDWKWAKRTETIERASHDHAEKCPDSERVLATPGPTKRRVVKGRLAHLWTFAKDALRQATCIVFVGYRFPETDAQARSEILSAIKKNDQPHVDMHVVLGRPGDHSLRLRRLLEAVSVSDLKRVELGHPNDKLPTFRVIEHPLLSQDFFTVVDRDVLIRHYVARHSPLTRR